MRFEAAAIFPAQKKIPEFQNIIVNRKRIFGYNVLLNFESGGSQ